MSLSWLASFITSSIFKRAQSSVSLPQPPSIIHPAIPSDNTDDEQLLSNHDDNYSNPVNGDNNNNDTNSTTKIEHLNIQRLPISYDGDDNDHDDDPRSRRAYEASAGVIWMYGQNAPISRDIPGGELPYLYEQCNVVSTLIKNRHQL